MTKLMFRVNEGLKPGISGLYGINEKSNSKVIDYSLIQFVDIEQITIDSFTSKSIDNIVETAKDVGRLRNHDYVVVEHRDYKHFIAKYYVNSYKLIGIY